MRTGKIELSSAIIMQLSLPYRGKLAQPEVSMAGCATESLAHIVTFAVDGGYRYK